jgi:response regulator NasT
MPSSPTSTASPPAPPAAPLARILVVDDDRLVLATVSHGLAEAGYEVIDADNGDEAILLARQHRPALALLDIRMEGKSGFDVAATLREAYRIPFIFFSAFADEATRAEVRRLGALDYLVKPLDVAQIVPRVAAALERVGREAVGASAPAPRPHAAPDATPNAALNAAPEAAPEAALDAKPGSALAAEILALATGVLMHRHSLDRVAARQRIDRMAAEQGLSALAQAERLVGAVEELARSGG